jgi:hypothetical protein
MLDGELIEVGKIPCINGVALYVQEDELVMPWENWEGFSDSDRIPQRGREQP